MRADSVVPFGDCAPWEKISKSDARKLTKRAQGAPASPRRHCTRRQLSSGLYVGVGIGSGRVFLGRFLDRIF